MVIYHHSTVITKVKLLFNTEWRYDHGMAVNYRGKKFYNIGPRREFLSVGKHSSLFSVGDEEECFDLDGFERREGDVAEKLGRSSGNL